MSTKNTKGKVAVKSQTAKEVKQVEVEVEVEAVAQPEPKVEVKQTQKGGKKSTKQAEPVQQSEPVVEVKQTQKGGKKTTKKADEPVAQPEPVVEVKQTQKGGKKTTKKADEPVVEVKQTQKGDKKTTKKADEPVAQPEPKVKVEVELEVEAEEEEGGGKLRYFKLFYNEEYQGRYCGRKPKQAANKAFSSIIKDMKKNGNQKGGVNVDINFSIRECTRNSRHKEYNYVGVREHLKEPVAVDIKNEDGSVKNITYSFKNKISKAPKVQA